MSIAVTIDVDAGQPRAQPRVQPGLVEAMGRDDLPDGRI